MRVGYDERLDDVILRLYDAALDETLWPELLTAVADLGRGSCTHLVGFDLPTRLPTFGHIGRYPQEAHEDYALNYAHRDPRVGRMLGRVGEPRFDLVTDADLTTPEERRRCAVHQEFLPRWRVDRCLIQGFPIGADRAGYLAIHRSSASDPPFEAADARTVTRLVRHLGKAFEVRERIGHLQAEVANLEAAIDALPSALLLTDGRGQIAFASRSALDMLRRADGLGAAGGRLSVPSSGIESAILRALLADASRSLTPVPRSGGLCVTRGLGRSQYQLVVAPLPSRSPLSLLSERADVLVLISDPDSRASGRGELLAALYRLTPAETRLALGLYDGSTLQEYADQNGIARDTAKNQLARVFAKSGCRKQSELIKLIAAIPTPEPSPGSAPAP